MYPLSHPSGKFLDVSIHLPVYMSTEDGILSQPILHIVVLHGDSDHLRWVTENITFIVTSVVHNELSLNHSITFVEKYSIFVLVVCIKITFYLNLVKWLITPEVSFSFWLDAICISDILSPFSSCKSFSAIQVCSFLWSSPWFLKAF
jgi:hypothetical protein